MEVSDKPSYYPRTGRQYRSNPLRRRRSWWRLVLAGIFIGLLLWEGWLFSEICWWRTHNPSDTAFMRQREASRQEHGLGPLAPHPWVAYEVIPRSLKQGVVAAEDSAFVHHSGFDWQGIRQAYERDRKRHRWVAGGSTITQQLAKNLFLSENRSLWRKAQETVLTVMLEVVWSKRRILDVYLNTIEWGEGEFGCAAASGHYFHVPVAHLSRAQSARLASMIPRPRYYDHHGPTGQLWDKIATIEQRMNQVDIPP